MFSKRSEYFETHATISVAAPEVSDSPLHFAQSSTRWQHQLMLSLCSHLSEMPDRHFPLTAILSMAQVRRFGHNTWSVMKYTALCNPCLRRFKARTSCIHMTPCSERVPKLLTAQQAQHWYDHQSDCKYEADTQFSVPVTELL
jgi:hypothetical protein